MRLYKTQKARDVLMSQNLALSQAERRVLILCDGQRTRTALEKMLGTARAGSIDMLIAQGYLQAAAAMEATPTADTAKAPGWSALARKLGATDSGSAKPLPALPMHLEPVERASVESVRGEAPSPLRSATRRSLAASKMYMLDMLQLQRNMESSALAVDIQTASDAKHLAAGLLQALRHLCASTKPSMAQRIAQRLQETMPEEDLPMLQDVIATLFDDAPRAAAAPDKVVAMRRDVA